MLKCGKEMIKSCIYCIHLPGLKFLAFADKTSPREGREFLCQSGVIGSIWTRHVRSSVRSVVNVIRSFSIHNNCARVSFPWGGLFQYWLRVESRTQNRQWTFSVLRLLGTFRNMKLQTWFFGKANMRLILASCLGLARWRFWPLFWRESRVFVQRIAAIQSVNFKDGFLALVAWK